MSFAITLPEEVIVEILSRLPVKSLLRFRCVCKSWYTLIRHPSFIAKHLTFNNNGSQDDDNVRLLVHHSHRVHPQPLDEDVIFSYSPDTLEVSEHIRVPFLKKTSFYQPQLTGPCNGILCLNCFDDSIALWNPATREFKLVHPSDIKLPHPPDKVMSTGSNFVGFGFDPETDDYKLVVFVITYLVFTSFPLIQKHLYSLRTDSWKEIYADLPFVHESGTYFSGCFYWTADDNCIISFDMTNEVFHKIPLPDFGSSNDVREELLSEFNGSLVLSTFTRITERSFNIWEMNRYDAKETWTKLFTIESGQGLEWPLGFWKNGCLFMRNSNHELVLYDPATQNIRNLGTVHYLTIIRVISYVESLVPIFGRQEHEIDEPILRF